jgi:hypothetical protein
MPEGLHQGNGPITIKNPFQHANSSGASIGYGQGETVIIVVEKDDGIGE